MPYKRPGEFYYPSAAATAAIKHGAPVAVENHVGIAVKQKASRWSDGFATQDTIAVGEKYGVITRGVVEVTDPGGLAKGAAVYITTATGALGGTGGAGTLPFGRVHEVVGDGRGVRTGKIRVNLDAKDSI